MKRLIIIVNNIWVKSIISKVKQILKNKSYVAIDKDDIYLGPTSVTCTCPLAVYL